MFILVYKVTELPAEVRKLLKTNYYHFSINKVTEITRNGKTAYGVNLKDGSSWKMVKVVAREIEVVTEYTESTR